MTINYSTPWHKASYDRFLLERFPQLLADNLPLAGYEMQQAGDGTCCVAVILSPTNAAASGDLSSSITLNFQAILYPDEDGIFEIHGEPHVVVPTASDEYLETAELRCVGEQLHDHIRERLGQAPRDLPWDERLARAWLPLDAWIQGFMDEKAQRLDTTNWLSRYTHLRRIILLNREKMITPGQAGRVCPFETPEGPNIGRVFTVATGAEVRDGRLVITDDRPEATLGLCASMIPFLENNDPNRLLMGANMLRQALVPAQPEPAWVQTGNEPDIPGFWCGRNLLTAFVSWGEGTSEDGIIISESCARRLDYPYPVEPGDKLANRHGAKGVVSRILPDEEMPHLPDGTAVELVYNFIGLRTRMHIGQVREAVLSRIARIEGTPAIVPPYHAPSADELREHLVKVGLPATGMETLTLGKSGAALERPSTVGWVYWNRLAHLAKDKFRASVSASEGGQIMGENNYTILRQLGAYENIQEMLNTRSARCTTADFVEQADAPTPMFTDLSERLRIAGIRAELDKERVVFCFAPPEGDVLELAHPLPHPWLSEKQIMKVGSPASLKHTAERGDPAFPGWVSSAQSVLPTAEYTGLVEANTKLRQLLSSQVPERLVRDAEARLEERLNAFCDALLPQEVLHYEEAQLFSARAVAAPAVGLHLDQVGLPDELCWKLFGPFVEHELKGKNPLRPDDAQAKRALDEIMARSWVIIHRPPALTPTTMLAFRPVRDPGRVVRLNPIVCYWLTADFDGDQVSVFLPLTAGAQREAQELLSVSAHLRRDPSLIRTLLPSPEVIWGLAYRSLTPQGLQEIAHAAGVEVESLKGILTQAGFVSLMESLLKQKGCEAALETLEKLAQLGYECVRNSGASMSPFLGSSLERPDYPKGNDVNRWEAYGEELAEKILSITDYHSLDMGPQLLDSRVRTWVRRALPFLIGWRGVVMDTAGKPFIVRHSYTEGLTPEEMNACVAGARQGLAQMVMESEQLAQNPLSRSDSSHLTVLARARRAKRPGIIFARAAASGEADPLEDVDSRLLVGLQIRT